MSNEIALLDVQIQKLQVAIQTQASLRAIRGSARVDEVVRKLRH